MVSLTHSNKASAVKKAALAVSLIIALLISMAPYAFAANETEDNTPVHTRKQEMLHEVADILRGFGYAEDSEVIKALQKVWWQEQEDLNIIAKVIRYEADPAYCDWEHSVAVGVVILNRVKCQWFKGDTVKEIVAAPGQYLASYTYGFEGTPRLCYLAAKAAMDGNHEVPSNAYWQDNHVQGKYIWKAFVCDTGWFRSTTYICCGVPGTDD